MESLINALKWILDNWASIIVVITLILSIYARVMAFIDDWKTRTAEEKAAAEKAALDKAIELAKKAVKDYILIFVSQAETDWEDANGKFGKTKRAQVIAKVYETYPVLEEVEDKEALLNYIDELIDEALETIKEELGE